MRISRGRAAAIVAAVVVVVIAGVVLLGRGGDDGEKQTVERSDSRSYPSRGALIDDETLTEGAAEAWRDATQRTGEREDSRPDDRIDVLYAGRMSGEKLSQTGQERHKMHDVVVLSSHRLVATMIRPKGGEWDVRDTVGFEISYTTEVPLIDLGSGLYLAAAGQFADDKAEVISLPREVDPGDAPDGSPNEPKLFTADLTDPLWTPGIPANGPLVVRLPGQDDGTFVGQVWMGLGPGGSSLLARSTGGASAEEKLWRQLASPADSATTAAAFRAVVDSVMDGDDGTQAFSISAADGVTITSLGSATLRGTPDGDRRASAVSIGFGHDRSSEAVAVGLTGPDVHQVVRTMAVVLGQHPQRTAETLPIAAAWVSSDLGQLPYLVYAVDPTLDRIDLRVGAEKVATNGSLGFYVPAVDAGRGGRPPTTLIGFDHNGVSYPAFPITSR